MSEPLSTLAIYGSLLLAGLAGSLHCVGMCGPILLAFSRVFDPAGRRPLVSDFFWYHTGRLWTYALLGFVAGWLGHGLRNGSALLGWQRPLAFSLAVGVVLSGLLLAGLLPGVRVDALVGDCALARFRERPWFRALLAAPGPLPRLLLGAAMGLLPCGLVYAMLVVVAALPGPLASAGGMLAFGLGTLPALSAVLLAGRLIPRALRVHGTRVAAFVLVAVGCFMLARTLLVSPGAHPGHGPALPAVEQGRAPEHRTH